MPEVLPKTELKPREQAIVDAVRARFDKVATHMAEVDRLATEINNEMED
jgi:hypothetical protein